VGGFGPPSKPGGNMNIVIGQPVLDRIEAVSVVDLINLLFHSQRRQLHYVPSIGCTIIHEARNNIVSQAYGTEFDGILMIDADMTFPGNLLEKMIENDKDVCGVLYQSHTGKLNAFKHDEQIDEFLRTDIEPEQGLVEVDAVGSGIIYIKRKVLDTIGSPWFFYEMGVGEDVNFCKVAKELGFKIFVDTDINVGHVGKQIRRVKCNG